MEILVEKREEFLPAGYVVLEKSCPWVTQSFNNLCKTLYDCTTRFVFPTKAGNAETLSGGFNDHFSGYWMYGLFMIFDCRVYLGFWTTVPVSKLDFSRSLSCLVYPRRAVSGKACLWRKFIFKILAVLLVVGNHWRSHIMWHDAYGRLVTFVHVPFSPPLLLILAFQPILFHTIVTEGHYMLFFIEDFFF